MTITTWYHQILLVFHVEGCWLHDDVIKWKHFPRYWPFVRGIRRSSMNSPKKGQWRGALMFSLICAWINDWVNNRKAGVSRRYRTQYDVTAIIWLFVENWQKMQTYFHVSQNDSTRQGPTVCLHLPTMNRSFLLLMDSNIYIQLKIKIFDCIGSIKAWS